MLLVDIAEDVERFYLLDPEERARVLFGYLTSMNVDPARMTGVLIFLAGKLVDISQEMAKTAIALDVLKNRN